MENKDLNNFVKEKIKRQIKKALLYYIKRVSGEDQIRLSSFLNCAEFEVIYFFDLIYPEIQITAKKFVGCEINPAPCYRMIIKILQKSYNVKIYEE
ncbi:MAG: hypothetical protein NTZ97_04750 [Candidatus Moranbacteria bacterium]|nr:hypothetical protein [Candidatus Moranbacteria bacterium]